MLSHEERNTFLIMFVGFAVVDDWSLRAFLIAIALLLIYEIIRAYWPDIVKRLRWRSI